MPHKQKKASNNHALNIGSPRADEKQQQQQPQSVPDDSPFTSPVLAPTNYREIHQNEVEALRSIYGDDFEEVQNRRSAWHVSYCGSGACVQDGVLTAAYQQSSDVCFKLHLRSSSDAEVHLELLVELPATYPKTCPNLSLENLADFREGAQSRILDIVRNKPQSFLGTEMIYELAVSIQDVLEDVAQAKAQDKDLPSLEEERMKQEAAAVHRAELERQEELRRQESATAEEELALQQLLENKIKERSKARLSQRKSRTPGVDSNGLADTGENVPGAISFDPPLVMSDSDKQPLVFRAVSGKTLLGSSQGKEAFTVRPVVSESGLTLLFWS